MTQLTRRQFLRSAGGVTFLALSPAGCGLFAATSSGDASWPIFSALPYIQPGPNSKLVQHQESVVIAWQTQSKPANFRLTYGPTAAYGKTADITRHERPSGDGSPDQAHFNYAASLQGLRLGTRYFYHATCNGRTLMKGYFTTRQGRGQPIRFVAFGDNAHGGASDRAIAYQAYRAHPDFVMNTGDNVYDGGLDDEYAKFFFPVYNNDTASPDTGAPLLRSVPFYTVMANHDVRRRNANKQPVGDFSQDAGSLAYYTNLHLPQNGFAPAHPTLAIGDAARVAQFKACAGNRYPRQANYSFDYGDAHFLCLDSNIYVDPTNAQLQAWIARDLSQSDAQWKFVVYHHPDFNAGDQHGREQHMRVLAPLFERHGVDFALHGHEHNYQRHKPLRFQATDASKASDVNKGNRIVPGTFRLDEAFDGRKNTQPKGVIHVVTGAGGARLYDAAMNEKPQEYQYSQGDAPYVSRFISDRHSLTLFEINDGRLQMRQIDESGQVIETIRVVKS